MSNIFTKFISLITNQNNRREHLELIRQADDMFNNAPTTRSRVVNIDIDSEPGYVATRLENGMCFYTPHNKDFAIFPEFALTPPRVPRPRLGDIIVVKDTTEGRYPHRIERIRDTQHGHHEEDKNTPTP